MIAFAALNDTACPLTLDALAAEVDALKRL